MLQTTPRTACWLFLVLSLAGPSLATGLVKPNGCDCNAAPLSVVPWCGADGEWYQNACLGYCAGVPPGTGTCDGSAMPFDTPPPTESYNPDILRNITAAIINAYKEEGFRYMGRIRLARDLGPRPDAPNSTMEDPPKDSRGKWNVRAVRCTNEGDVYIGSMDILGTTTEHGSFIPEWALPSPQPILESGTISGSSSSMGGSSDSLSSSSSTGSKGLLGLKPPTCTGFSIWKPLKSVLCFAGGVAEKVRSLLTSGSKALVSSRAAARQALVTDKGTPSNTGSSSSSKGLSGRKRRLAATAGVTAIYSDDEDEGGMSDDGSDGNDDDGDDVVDDLGAVIDHQRSLKEIISNDDRFACSSKAFPYTAIGQIQVVDNSGMYICTGTLIKPNKVLTAAHCVWNTKRSAFYFNLNFAPGRYNDNGQIVNPWGVVPWKSVTILDAFKKNPSTWDVAVVTLQKPLGSLTGYMGMAAGCSSNALLTVGGYPQDKPQGTCMASTCTQDYLDCNAPTNSHQCDTIMGMSGSPLWDKQNRIRMIHVAGIEGRQENRATTLTQFLVNAVYNW